MKSYKKIILLFLVSSTLLISATCYSQNYIQAIGLRGGIYSGVNYKNFIGNAVAVEGILTRPWKGWELIGLLEKHAPMGRCRNLFFYYGFGAHIGNYDARYTRHSTGTYMVIGADGVVGLEYEFNRLPLALGIDWKPYFNLIGSSGFFTDGGGISFRYTFD